ncbi:uncharacterized protein LOC130655085 isoform X2 [Hydractinia symbiolongicarpus]|uniref:uncharacterized protein LOC130655085 isoform X2 n=1 Tax=Hydractinia symbiolongicarpus TaxID=13093 RepID=UPI00254B8363|nr:uncharacterized protein LOC130655085 isoform X2 [Hydractinia symbiolongicarpus]
MHMNHCVNTTLEGRQLRGEKKSSNIVGQTCPMCGVKMSKEKFASHVRKCAKSLKYSDQQLMKILQTQGISTEQRSNKMSAAQRKKHFKSNIKKGQLSTIIKPRDKEATNEHIKTQAKSILTESTSAHHILSTPPSTPAMKKSLIGKMNEETSSHTSVNEAPQKPNHTVALIKDSGCKLWNLSSFDMKTNRTNFVVSALKDKLGVQPSLQSENEIQQNVVQIADESFTDTQCDKLDILMALNSSIEQKKNDNGFIFDNTEDKLSELHKQSNQKLLEDFTALLQESVPYDFTFHCKDGVNVSCHKFMLVTRCHTFREIILNGEDDAIVSDISSAAVNAFINYIYCGAVNFLHVLDEVYVLANRYNLDFLTQACIFLKPTLHDKNDTSHNSQQSTDVDKLVSTFWKKKEFDNDAEVNELEKSWGILQNISKEDNDVGRDSSFSENELALMKEVFQTQAQLENSINKENVDDDTTSQADFESTVMLNEKQQSDSPTSTVNVLVPDSFEISPVSTSKDNFAQVGCSPVQSDAYQHDKHISSYEDDHCENAPQVEVIEVHGSPSETAVDKMEKSMDYISPSATPIPLSCETPAINTPLCVRDRRQDDKVATPLRELSYDDTTVVKESNENSEIEVLSLNNTAIFKTTGTTKHAGESLANPQDICEYTTQRNSAYSVSKIDENTGFSVAPAYQSDKKFSGNETSGSGVSPSYVESPCVIRKSEIVSSTPNLCTSNQINSSFGNKDINHSAIAKSSSEKRNMISVVLDYCSEKEGKTREKKLSSTQTNTPFLLEKQMTRKRLHEFSSTESISSDEDGYDRFKQREKKKLKRSNKRDNNEMKKSQLSSINVTSSDEHVSENEVVETDNFVCTNISPARLKSTSTPSGRLNKRKSRSPYSPVVTPSQWLSTSDRRLSTEKKKKCSSVKPNNGNKKKKNSFKDLVKEVANEVSSTSVESISSSSGECTNEQEKNKVSNLYERTVPNDSGEKFDSSNTNKQISDENQHLPSSQTGFKPDDGSVSMPENEYSIYYMDDGGYNSFTIEPGTVDEDQNIHGSIVVENQTKPGENTSINLDTAKQRKESIPDENDNVTKVDVSNQTEKDNNLALIANIKSLKAFTSDKFLEPFQIDSVKDDCSKSSGNVNNNVSFDNATHSRDNDSIPNIVFENDSFAAYCMTNNDVASTSGTENKNAKMVERNTATPVGVKNTATFKTPICTSIAAKNFPAGCDRHPETNEPITPMPDYSNYPTPQLQEEIKKYALRDMAKPKMIAKMKEVYKFQHNFTNWEEEPCKNVKRKPRKKKEANNTNEENKTTEEKEEKESGKNRKKAATKTEENTEGPSTHEMLNNLIKSDRSLHTKILSYEPLEFSEVLSLIVANSIKCSKKMLEKYLDEQCICYYSAKDESQKPRTRNQRKKKK